MVGLIWFIVAVLLAVWIAGLVANFLGGFIWILFVAAIALIIFNLLMGRSATSI